jgi:hypothetical protein
VAAAILCERALQEKDGVYTLVRIIDQLNVELVAIAPGGERRTLDPTTLSAEELEQLPWPEHELVLMVMLKGGQPNRLATIRLEAENPRGERTVAQEGPYTFGGVHGGLNLHVKLRAAFRHEGSYWFDVYCDGRLLSRVPLRVSFQRPQPASDSDTEGTS